MSTIPSQLEPPPVQWPEVAKVSMGFNPEGTLAVRVLINHGVELLPGLREAFGLAAEAFLRQMAEYSPVRCAQRNAGDSPALDRVSRELAARDGASLIGFDGPTDVS